MASLLAVEFLVVLVREVEVSDNKFLRRSYIEMTNFMFFGRPMIAFLMISGSMLACSRDFPDAYTGGHVTPVGEDHRLSRGDNQQLGIQITAEANPVLNVPVEGTPTPDPTRPVDQRSGRQTHVVLDGDTLESIARAHGVALETLMVANNIEQSDWLSIGQELIIPDAFLSVGRSNKLIPDSELVYSPSTVGFDVEGTVSKFGGYLASFNETDDAGVSRTGAEIVTFVVQSYSVNPRLLLAVLDYQSGWVTNRSTNHSTQTYPLGYVNQRYKGLLKQLSWVANILNSGFYGWRNESLSLLDFPNGSRLVIAPGLNAGSAAVQYLFSQIYEPDRWSEAVAPGGLQKTLYTMFGSPFDFSYDPLIPDGLVSPSLQWPWDTSERWYYTGGPHGGWDSGSAWAAVDFAPPRGEHGCAVSPRWVLAAAEGMIVHSDNGAVIQDLDGDGLEQTGWTILYMHIDTGDRVKVGQYLAIGDKIGHPSCEGGYSNATHLHIARRYNGVWISVDDTDLPLLIDGWKFTSSVREYDGWVEKGNIRLEAWDSQGEINAIIARDD